MLVCVFLHFCTRDRRCSAHPAFPAPSDIFGRNFCKTSGEPRREIAEPYLKFSTSLRAAEATPTVIASEAKQSIARATVTMDCFVRFAPRNDGPQSDTARNDVQAN